MITFKEYKELNTLKKKPLYGLSFNQRYAMEQFETAIGVFIGLGIITITIIGLSAL